MYIWELMWNDGETEIVDKLDKSVSLPQMIISIDITLWYIISHGWRLPRVLRVVKR